MRRFIFLTSYVAVLLLARWPWNALIVLTAVCCTLPRERFANSGSSCRRYRSGIEGSQRVQNSVVSTEYLEAATEYCRIVGSQHLPYLLSEPFIDGALSTQSAPSQNTSEHTGRRRVSDVALRADTISAASESKFGQLPRRG